MVQLFPLVLRDLAVFHDSQFSGLTSIFVLDFSSSIFVLGGVGLPTDVGSSLRRLVVFKLAQVAEIVLKVLSDRPWQVARFNP